MAVTPFEVKILPLSKNWFLLLASFYMLYSHLEVILVTFKKCTPTATFSHNKNQAASSTRHLIMMK